MINPLRYRGKYYDPSIGMYYLQSRYYDPVIGRFINADATWVLGVEQDSLLQFNLFTFCLNNPVNGTDDEGYFKNILAGALVGGLIGAVSQVVSNAITGQPLTQGVAAATASGAISGAAMAAGAGLVKKAVSAVRAPAIATPRPPAPSLAAQTARPVAPRPRVRIESIGRQNPVNRSGNGHFGVRYARTVRTRTGGTTTVRRSIELHRPHGRGHRHNVWHWQRNTWSNNPNRLNHITRNSAHWRIWGTRM